MKNLIKLISLLLLLTACASPKISNLEKGRYRYKDSKFLTKKNIDVLDVSVSRFPLTVEEKAKLKSTTFLDMRDSLPHLYMKLLADKTKSVDSFMTQLAKPVMSVPKSPTEKKQTDYTKFQVQFVFSNLKKYYNAKRFMHPNTRLEFLTTYLSLSDNSGITFYSIDKLQNEFDEIDLGMVSRDQNVSLNAGLNVSGGLGGGYENNSDNTTSNTNDRENNTYDANNNLTRGNAQQYENKSNSSKKSSAEAKINATAEVSYLNNETIKEVVAVKLRRLKTGFNFSDTALVISQRGRMSGDISDNIYVVATLNITNQENISPSLSVFSFENLYTENNQPTIADKLLFSSRKVSFVSCENTNTKDITFTTQYEGAIRATRNSWPNAGRNALEYDDRVTFYKIGKTEAKKHKITIDKTEYCKEAYRFIVTDYENNRYVLKIVYAHNDIELAVFIDDQPEILLKWLQDILLNPDMKNLSTEHFCLYFEKIDKTKQSIPIVQRDMKLTDIEKIRLFTQKIKHIGTEVRKR